MDEEKRYKDQLLRYPSFLKILEFMKEERLLRKCFLNTSEDLECELEEELEYSTAFNVISFTAFQLGDQSKAKEFNDRALRQNRDDIIALVNKGWFSLKSNEIDFVECQNACEHLKTCAQSEINVLEAKAQIAFLLSRLGPNACKKAEECFSEVLQVAIKTEGVPDSHIMIWNFGLGLIRRRLLNVFNCSSIDKDMLSEQKFELALEPFLENMSKDGANSKHRARSIMYVGEIVYSLTYDFSEKLRNKLKLEDTEYYLNLAIKLQPNDYYILQRSGRQFKYLKDTNKAAEYLKKAIEIRPTSFAHQNLALVMKMEIMTEKSQQKPIPNRPKKLYRKRNKNMLKSPRNVTKCQNTREVESVFFHLKEAVKMDENNVSSLYDIGLLYRSTQQFDEAKDTFKRLRTHPGVSPVILKNTYEQLAYCLLDRLDYSDDRERDRANAVKYLKQAVELTCNTITKNNPEMKEACGGVPTLKELLSCSEISKENLKDYADVCELLEEYREALEVLYQLIKKNCDTDENFETYMKIVRILKGDNDISGAIMTLNLLMILPDGPGNIDLDLYIEVHIEGGIESYLSGDKALAKERLQKAIQFRENPNNVHTLDYEEAEDGKNVDIFILSQSFSSEGISLCLMKLLKDMGIRTTVDDFDIAIGTLWFKRMEKMIEDSKRFIIVCDSPEDPSNEYNRVLNDIEYKGIESGGSNIVVIKSSQSSVLQSTLKKYPSAVACDGIKQADTEQQFGPDTIQWTKELLLKVLCRK